MTTPDTMGSGPPPSGVAGDGVHSHERHLAAVGRRVYPGDLRAGRIERCAWVQPREYPGDQRRWLLLCGPAGAAKQVLDLVGPLGSRRQVPAEYTELYSHCLEFIPGPVGDLPVLVELLTQILTLTNAPHVDHGFALDWYKVPDDSVDPKQWLNTTVGDLVNRGKYRGYTVRIAEIADVMADVIARHPLLRAASTIVTVPGSDADGKSFAEHLARAVGRATRRDVCLTQSATGPRAPRKAATAAEPPPEFWVPMMLCDPVIVIDDVYRTGTTMGAAALAARAAGAPTVYGFAAARTCSGA